MWALRPPSGWSRKNLPMPSRTIGVRTSAIRTASAPNVSMRNMVYFASLFLADLLKQFPDTRCIFLGRVIRERALKLFPGRGLVAFHIQRQAEVITKNRKRIPSRQIAECLNGAIVETLLQVNVTDCIRETWLAGNLLQRELRQPQRFIQVAARIGQEKSRIVQGRRVLGMRLHHALELNPRLIGAASPSQGTGQTQGRAEVLGRQFMGLSIMGDLVAVIPLEFINLSYAPMQNYRLRI